MWRKENPHALLVGMQTGEATTQRGLWSYLKKLKMELTALRPSNSTSGNTSKGTQSTKLKGYKHPFVHCSIIYNSQDLEAAQVSISRWVDKKAVVHLHNGILLSYKKNKEILPFATEWMELESIMLSEISQLEKEKYHMISLIYGI